MDSRSIATRVHRPLSPQVSEQRVAGAEHVNKDLMAVINKLRHGRSDFLHQVSSLNERESAMAADMKHFAQAAHSSLDEKEKLEARLKRQQFDYKQANDRIRYSYNRAGPAAYCNPCVAILVCIFSTVHRCGLFLAWAQPSADSATNHWISGSTIRSPPVNRFRHALAATTFSNAKLEVVTWLVATPTDRRACAATSP